MNKYTKQNLDIHKFQPHIFCSQISYIDNKFFTDWAAVISIIIILLYWCFRYLYYYYFTVLVLLFICLCLFLRDQLMFSDKWSLNPLGYGHVSNLEHVSVSQRVQCSLASDRNPSLFLILVHVQKNWCTCTRVWWQCLLLWQYQSVGKVMKHMMNLNN